MSSRPHYKRDQPASKRGHASQISISDDSHHVTEAIGDLYGDHQYNSSDNRPLSFIASVTAPVTASPLSPQTSDRSANTISPSRSYSQRRAFGRTTTDDPLHPGLSGPAMAMHRSTSMDSDGGSSQRAGGLSPSGSLRRQPSISETATSHFPLNNIDYESNPTAIAQELNNLSALRRMSMDVNASSDPDLPSFVSALGIPSEPAQGTNPDDRSRLYWVPASVHPELAPMEFKTFLDKKVKSLKRRSEERQNSLLPAGSDVNASNASLRRRKSMLSKQIDNTDGQGAEGYEDGADLLERRRSQNSGELLSTGVSSLLELEALVKEPDLVLQRLSLDNNPDLQTSIQSGEEDRPILPSLPTSSNSLKRSTRTTYRRGGSLRRGERTPFSKRAAQLGGEAESHVPSNIKTTSADASEIGIGLARVQTDPTPLAGTNTGNFSRPHRSHRPNRNMEASPPIRHAEDPARSVPPSDSEVIGQQTQGNQEQPSYPQRPQQRQFVSQISSNGRLGVPLGRQHAVPMIVETPPDGTLHPLRTSSHTPPPPHVKHASPSSNSQSFHHQRMNPNRNSPPSSPVQTLTDMTAHPSPLPGTNIRTDNLSFIPTLPDDKRSEYKRSKDRKDKEHDGARKSSWSWGSLLGSEEKEKEKRKAEEARKGGFRYSKGSDKVHENSRLDVLQTTMDPSRGRESLILERGDLRLEEERRKESSRKSAGSDTKREKEAGFFSNLLGGKKKGDRDSTGKKGLLRALSPDPPLRILKPDIDYNWTRFSILEERAIYRMAHIKLANPRRALQSQVLLSNFMYSYLAKVQQMHPQSNLPQSPGQRSRASQQKNDQPEEFTAYQKYQEQQQREEEEQAAKMGSQPDNFMDMDNDYDSSDQEFSDRGHEDSASQGPHPGKRIDTEEEHDLGAIGNYDRRTTQRQQQKQYSQGRNHDSGAETTPYAYQKGQFDDTDRHDDEDDMW